MPAEWFSTWFDSPYYHVLYQSHDDKEAQQFIDKLLVALNLPPRARVLDLACGKGRHARHLAEKGFDVTGLDISPASVAFARHFEHEHLAFFQHDMRLPYRVNYFDGIVNMFTSFGYFDTDRDHVRTLANVAKGLKPGGVFLLDFFNAELVRRNLVRHDVKTIDGITFHLHKTIRAGRVHKRVEFETGGRKFVFRERVRLFSQADFQVMFGAVGLELKHTFGDYDLGTFAPASSKRLILIAKKPL
ncbi:MAG: class I SAM-dependent methyltransferase [Saprospiraceae bacterium]